MYKIIGADGKEYGPVTAEQLRQWIGEGRVNGQTMTQAEGSAESKPLSAFPEFADVPGGAPSPSQPPPGGPIDSSTQAAQVLDRGYNIDIGSCISRAWELVKNNFWRLVGTSLLIFLTIGGVGVVLRFGINFACGVPFYTPHVRGLALLRYQWPGLVANAAWNMLMSGALLGGLYNYYLKLMRGQPATVGDAFAGMSGAFVPLTLAHIVSSFLTGLGILFCILPGIYLAIAWKLTLPLVIDKRIGFWEALELSRKASTRQWWSLFALILLSSLITVSGLLLCCIGVFATAPIGIAAILYAYEDIFGAHTTAQAS